MFRNYLTIAYRNLLKHKVFSLVNMLGLSTAMSACFLIFYYISFELSYDEYHADAESIYRVALDKYQSENEYLTLATNFNALPKAIESHIPEIEAVTEALRPSGIHVFTLNQENQLLQFQEDHILYASEHFFDVFTHEWLAGNPSKALVAPYSIVLTESMAYKYFDNNTKAEDIIGKSLQVSSFSNDLEYTITGLIKDVPANTHLSFVILMSSSTFLALYPEENFEVNWEWCDTFVYIQTHATATAEQIYPKLQRLLEENSEAMGEGAVAKSKIILQPLTNIHLNSHLQMEAETNGSQQQIWFLIIIATALIMVAGLNYINLHTAQSLRRVKEVGIRKYVGAGKLQLGLQTLTETFLLLSFSVIASLTLLQFLIPKLQNWLDFSGEHSFNFYFIAFSLGAFGVLLALIGSYPTYFMAGFEPVQAIRGAYQGKRGLHRLQKGLVGFQLLISTLAIAFTLMLYQQYQFMLNQPLGFEEQILVFSAPTVQTVRGTEAYATQVRTFKDQLLESSAIQSVSASTHVPGMPLIYGTSKIYAEGQDAHMGVDMNFLGIDADYIATFGLKILAGQNFTAKPKPDEDAYILNESAALALGFTDFDATIGQYVIHHGNKHQIKAIINDYHQKSLREPIVPMAFANYPSHHEYFSVKMASSDVAETISFIAKIFDKHFADNPFTYYFLDDAFQQLYQADQQYNLFFHIFSALIVFIACLGLFSMASFTAQQKTKEIGIRKVLGASVQNIMTLLSGDFIKLALLSGMIALPLAYWAMYEWLQNYAYRIEISWWLLALPLLLVMLVALLTLSFRTIKATVANPSDSLRYE